MGGELAVRLEGDLESVSDIEVAATNIVALVADNDAGILDEVRRRAEAASLYERRAHNADREKHFWTMKILAEAGLGCLSFETPEVVSVQSTRSNYRVLASAFERGSLVDICRDAEQGRGGSWDIVNQIRSAGYTYAPGSSLGLKGSIPWRKARVIAREQGKSLDRIPPDRAYVRKREKQWAETSRRMGRRHQAAERLERMKRQKAVAAAVQDHSPELATAYGLLRRTMQAMYDAQSGMNRAERESLDDIFYHLHKAEDVIGNLTRGVLKGALCAVCKERYAATLLGLTTCLDCQ